MTGNIIRYILAVCFLVSGTLKSISIDAFAQEVQLYGEAYVGSWIGYNALAIAVIVCMIEISISIMSIFKRFERCTAVILFLLLIFFVYLTGRNLFFPPISGSIEACGCLGELIHFTPCESFAKSIVLWLMSFCNIIVVLKNQNVND